ncbi:MAG TPA: molybdopterin-binding protein [Pseudolabrys sp.]|nr:molybdopterin-binding protein [Pseudolabrys sp.]
MAAGGEVLQVIQRLTPLAEVLALIDAELRPVLPRTLDVAAAAGRVLAKDAAAPARPSAAIALHDGWAVAADLTLGAGGYAPAALPQLPARVEAGQAMPPDTDAVAPVDAVKKTAAGAEVFVALQPGEGVLAAGGDCDPALPLRRAGERLRPTDVAAFAAAGLARVTVREPRLRILPLRGSAIITAAARAIAADIERRGGATRLDETGRGLDVGMTAENTDAVVALGGTGSGRNDMSVHVLARQGRVAVHGVALAPGESAALGFVGTRPVLLLPGRLDAALAVWLAIGRHLLDALAAAKRTDSEPAERLQLTRKVASTIGLADLVPVRRTPDGEAEPLARGYLPLSALTRSDGWILVPPDSEGYAAGATVHVRPWP